MNVELLSGDSGSVDDMLKNIGFNSSGNNTVNVGGVLQSGFNAAGSIVSSIFGYKTAQLQQPSQSQPQQGPTQQQTPKSDTTKTALIVGGIALAGLTAITVLQ